MQNTTLEKNKLPSPNSFLLPIKPADEEIAKKPYKRLSVALPKKNKKTERLQLRKTRAKKQAKSDDERNDDFAPKSKRTLECMTDSSMDDNKKTRESLESILKSYNKTLKKLERDQEEEISRKTLSFAPILETEQDQLTIDRPQFRKPVTYFSRPTPTGGEWKEDLYSTKIDRPRLKAGTEVAIDLFDPYCDPAHPVRITINDILNAASMIKDHVRRTPCVKSRSEDSYGIELYFKKDYMQLTGSFKERGARNVLSLLPEDKKRNGVISASAGNHALALSYQGMKMKVPVTVVMPKYAPIIKIQRCRAYKADVIIDGNDMQESKSIAMNMARTKQMTYINGYDHPDIIAGQGTIGLEILDQVPDPYAVIVPVGGGSLIAGTAAAIKSQNKNTLVIGVESEKCPVFSQALSKHEPTFKPSSPALTDESQVPFVGFNALATAEPLIDKMLVVKEEWIALAITRLVEEEKCVIEGAGAAGFAAILQGLLPELKKKRVVVLLSGGNIDTTVLIRCLERGMALEGRLIKFSCQVSDKPGGMRELCDVVASQGVSIVDVVHERAWVKDIFTVEVKVICETRDWEQALDLKEALSGKFQNVVFPETPVAARYHLA